ncbi:hypothetical protein, conserved [Eimeria brunetti]|uniref:Rhodanese domain-containing protein n=1 Tax=Eimeria brunetti TaxID=51314 RepID=U6LRW5_9EIME|nr:hypothetical protein, conserved [Eimeria brunetti]
MFMLLQQMPMPLLYLLLVLWGLYDDLTGVRGYIKPARGPFLVPQTRLHERPTGQFRAFSSSSSRGCSNNRSNGSTSDEAVESECPRCVWLLADEETSPVVVGRERRIRASVFDDFHPKLSLELTEKNATACGTAVTVAVAPPTGAAPPVIEVVPVEVGIAPETKRALGLFRSSHKRHIFLPLCLLGPFDDLVGEDAHQGVAAQAGSPWEGQGTLSTRRPLQAQGPHVASRAAGDGSPPQSLLEALKEATCKALKLGADFCGGVPLQLVAQFSAPKTKCHSAQQPDSPAASQPAGQLPSRDWLDPGSEPTLHSLSSEEEALRILREHYGPLLAQYRRLPHSSACLPPSNIASDRTRSGSNVAATLRILRLPRGPRLSLHLQLEPPLPSVPFSTSGAPQDFPSPPPLHVTKTQEVGDFSTSAAPPPYQLVSLYKFFPVKSPKALAELLRALWGPRGVLGRAYVAEEGLNAQLAVPSVATSDLLGELQQVPGLEDGMQVTLDCLVAFEEYWRCPPFDALHIRPRHQVLRDGFAAPLDWTDCGEEVDASVWHRKLTEMLQQQKQQQQHARKMVLLDMRNADEYAVGHFMGAKCIDTPTFADSFLPGGPLEKALLQAGIQVPSRNATPSSSGNRGIEEDVEVLMYCTGGIRCVKAGAFLKQVLGFSRVTRLKGGILAYKNYIQSLRGACCDDPGCTSVVTEEKTPSAGVNDSSRDNAEMNDTAATTAQPQTAADRDDCERETQAQIQRRMQARHTHKKLLQQRGLWAIRAQQLLAALKHNATFESPLGTHPLVRKPEMEKAFQQEGRSAVLGPTNQDLWQWAHQVAATASSPSTLQETLLEEGRHMAKSLAGRVRGVPQFWSGHLHSRILSAISRLARPRSILEIGAFVGISSLALAEGLPLEERKPSACIGLVAIEKDPRAAASARQLISSSPWSHLITVVEADALQWLRSQPPAARNISPGQVPSQGAQLGRIPLQGGMLPEGGFDLIYLDAEKKKYADYVSCILDPQRPLLAPDGALLIDNTLWIRGHDGERKSWWEDTAAEEDAPRAKRYTKIGESMAALREALRNDPRISHVVLSAGIASGGRRSLHRDLGYPIRRQ